MHDDLEVTGWTPELDVCVVALKMAQEDKNHRNNVIWQVFGLDWTILITRWQRPTLFTCCLCVERKTSKTKHRQMNVCFRTQIITDGDTCHQKTSKIPVW